MRKQVKLLKHHTHFLTELVNVTALIHDVLPLKPDLPGSRFLQPVQAAQEGRFTRTGGSDDDHLFSPVDGFVDPFEHMEFFKGFLQIFNLDHCAPASFLTLQTDGTAPV